jgi:hypothetical protein
MRRPQATTVSAGEDQARRVARATAPPSRAPCARHSARGSSRLARCLVDMGGVDRIDVGADLGEQIEAAR